jgi:outer membrane autotransporter protein
MNGGALTNSGTITATAIAPSDSASAEGISINSLTGGTFLNNGTITATALGGTNSYAGGIFVGTLDGSITNSGAISGTATNQADGYSLYLTGGTGTVNNQAGGVLNGNLFADGTISVANAGRIELPANAAALIGGNYTQSGNGVLELGVLSDVNYASLTVSGTADFSASSRLYVNVDNANTLAEGNALLNVISAGSLTATAFNVTDNYALWNFTAAIDGNTVDLTVSPGLTILEAAQMGGASSAAFGVAGTLDAINAGTPSSDMNTVLASLNGMTEAEIAAATEQLMPAISGGVGHLTNQIAGVLPDAVDERLNSKRGLSSGDSLMSDHKTWVKPFGNWTDQDDRKGVFGYEADSYGIALGTDADTGADWRVGAAFAYSNSDVESKATNYRHQIDMDTYQIGVYGSHQIDADTALDLKAAWGMSSYDSSRRVDFLTPVRVANADYDSWHLRLNAKLSHQYAMDAATSLAPYLRADYVYVDVDSYRENGAGALDLNVNSDTEDAFILGVGADVSHTVNDNLMLKANLGVGYDISSDQSSLDASFVNDGAVFSTKGLDPDPLILRAGVGAVFAHIKKVEITGRYDIEARQDYKNQGVSVNLGWKF